ncbi:MAG TPA: hypothetical protein VH062_07660 [Polyangiaceae bacterium]|nr:hypothetical protein [Polyangiaceae bacterium]
MTARTTVPAFDVHMRAIDDFPLDVAEYLETGTGEIHAWVRLLCWAALEGNRAEIAEAARRILAWAAPSSVTAPTPKKTRPITRVVCVACEKPFPSKSPNARTCSDRCRVAASKRRARARDKAEVRP